MVKFPENLVSGEGSLLVCRLLPSHCVLTWTFCGTCAQGWRGGEYAAVSSYKDTSPTGSGCDLI